MDFLYYLFNLILQFINKKNQLNLISILKDEYAKSNNEYTI